jgi:signal transduction histidine kinase
MCIKVSRDEQLQARSCARTHRKPETGRRDRLLFVEALVEAAQARGGALFTPCRKAPLVSGDVSALVQSASQDITALFLPGHGAQHEEVELLSSAGEVCWPPLSELVVRLGLRQAALLVLREDGEVAAWVLLVDAPGLVVSRQRSLRAIGRALLNHLRIERRARDAVLQAQRLEDVAYASGDWLWETDAAHRYTWILHDRTRAMAGDSLPQVGQAIASAQVVDWVGEPLEPTRSLRDMLDQRRPIVRLVSREHDGCSTRYVSRSAVPVRDGQGEFCGYRGLARDVTESVLAKAHLWSREHQLAVMTLAKEQAEAANQAKSVLVSKVGHELRTPLNAIVGLAQLIRSAQPPQPMSAAVDRWVDQIARTGWHMADAIEMLMEFGRSGSGALRPGAGVEVAEVLGEAMRIVEQDAWRRGIVIALGGETGCCVHADRRAMRQVFINLLSNAIKYNVDHGGVSIVVRADGERVRIVVRDTGPGLTAEQRARLFQPFERLGAEKTGVQGHGLGLLVCRELLVAMNGAIDVDSTAGAGCAFVVSLPARARPVPSAGPMSHEALPPRCHSSSSA